MHTVKTMVHTVIMPDQVHDAVRVDGRPAGLVHGLAPGQPEQLSRIDRDTACVRCGGPATPDAEMVSNLGELGLVAWRKCHLCASAGSNSVDVAVDITSTLHVPVAAEIGDDWTAFTRAAADAAPPAFCTTRDTTLRCGPDGPPRERWSHPEVGTYLADVQRSIHQNRLRPSPVGTPCVRCGRSRDRSWRETTRTGRHSGSWVCSTCPPDPWGPAPIERGRTALGVREEVEHDGNAREHVTPYDQAARVSAGFRARHEVAGLARRSGWFPPAGHPDWPRFPEDWGPWDYLPDGAGDAVREWARYISSAVGAPPAAVPNSSAYT